MKSFYSYVEIFTIWKSLLLYIGLSILVWFHYLLQGVLLQP
jgi:hypothetical protein